jgi:hypothetical protein
VEDYSCHELRAPSHLIGGDLFRFLHPSGDSSKSLRIALDVQTD